MRAGPRRSRARSASSRTSAPGFDALLGDAAPAHRSRAAHRHHGTAGRGQEHGDHAARDRVSRSRADASASSPSTPRRRSPAARCSAIASAWRASRSIPGVFIRSLATRGSLGGLSSATRAVADVLDAFGFDRILIETVGVGQSELDIARAADTTVVDPRSGIGRLDPDAQGRADGDRGHLRREQGRPSRRGPRAQRHRADARHARAAKRCGTCPAHHGVDLKKIMNPARVAREAARDGPDRVVDAAGAAHRRGEGRGDRGPDHRARPARPLS